MRHTRRRRSIGLLLVVLLAGAFYEVSEIRAGDHHPVRRAVGEPIVDAGAALQAPAHAAREHFEKRFLEWDGDPNQMPTKDKRFIWVDMYARWRITDPLLVLPAPARRERSAQSRLDDILDGETRNAVASYDLIELVRSSNRQFRHAERHRSEEQIRAGADRQGAAGRSTQRES